MTNPAFKTNYYPWRDIKPRTGEPQPVERTPVQCPEAIYREYDLHTEGNITYFDPRKRESAETRFEPKLRSKTQERRALDLSIPFIDHVVAQKIGWCTLAPAGYVDDANNRTP